MVIITDANGNIQSPTIPENVYQGSNFANEIVFLAPLPQSNVATITFRLPNGQLLEEQPMTPYTDVPSEYNLSAWRFVLNDEVTQYYGQVTFQIYLYGASGNIWYINAEPEVDVSFSESANFKSNGQDFSSMLADGTDLYYGSTKVYDGSTSNWTDLAYRRVSFNQSFSNNTAPLLVWLRANGEEEAPTLITSVAGTFPVLRGVPRIPHSLPSQASWQQICTWLSTINASLATLQNKVDNNLLESKDILPYDSSFTYSQGASVFDKDTKTIYTSLQPNNYNKSLSDTSWWGATVVTGLSLAEVQALIQNHNTLNTAHNDIRNLIAGKQDQLSQAQLDAVNSGIDSAKVSQIATNTGNISTINGMIPAEASSSNKFADKKFVADNYVPMSFASRLYLSKSGVDTADLVNIAPTPDNANVLVVTSTNTSFDWDYPTITITRTLENEVQLNNTNSFAVDLYFDLSRNAEITFGAKIKVSTDNGSTWTYISSNQSFGEKTYNIGFNSEDIVVYTDLATNETYPVNTLIAIELFKKQAQSSSLTTTYCCGVEIDGANVYSFVEFNFANTRINTNQIENGAVTFEKLSAYLQGAVFNVIDANNIVSNTLTQDQFDLITNGKPTLIKGSFLGYENPFLLQPTTVDNNTRGMIMGNKTGGTYIYLSCYQIASLVISEMTSGRIRVTLDTADFGSGAKVTKDSDNRLNFQYNNSVKVKVGSNDTLFANRVTPDSSNTYDLGRSGVYWKDLYLAGILSDGVNSISVANIANKNSILEKFAPAYDENESYSEGNFVTYNGSFYQCVADTTGTFNPNDWTEVSYTDIVEYGMKMLANSLIVLSYDENESYAVGDYALSPNFELVRCISATTGEYDDNDWETTTVESELKNKASKTTSAEYTLYSANWVSNTYTLSITGKTSGKNALVCPSNTGTDADVLSNVNAIASANIYKITDNGTSLTFVCETTPLVDLKITVEVYE